MKSGEEHELPKLSSNEWNGLKSEIQYCKLDHFIDLIDKRILDSTNILTKEQTIQLLQLCEFR